MYMYTQRLNVFVVSLSVMVLFCGAHLSPDSSYVKAKNISIYVLVSTPKVCEAIYSVAHLKMHC